MESQSLVDALRHEREHCENGKGLKMKTGTTEAAGNSCDGKLVKVSENKLTSTCEKGHEHNYTVAKEVKVTCDGKDAKLTDLKSGSTIRMTMCKDDKNKILAVDCGKHIPSLTPA
jgi:hypothetical protein